MIKVLFVCMGNICRSPTAEGVFRRRLSAHGLGGHVSVDSAGTHGWHAGNPPDPRSISAARQRGIDIGDVRSRKVRASDFTEFDYVLAMDRDNLADLAEEYGTARAQLFLEFASQLGETDVPDPYYGGDHGFDHVLDLVEAASEGLIAHIRATHF